MSQSIKTKLTQETELNLPESLNQQGVAATEIRPWGSFTTLEEGNGYKIKRIEVNPGHRLSTIIVANIGLSYLELLE
jgi:mannose-6-phosphate isomerase